MTTPRTVRPAHSAPSTAHTSQHDLTFWVSVGIGGLFIAYGFLVLVELVSLTEPTGSDNPIETAPAATAQRFAVILLLNDLVLMPLVFGFAAVVLRRAPSPWLPPTQFALFVSAMVVLIAIWGLAGQSIEVQPGNDQVLPNNYLKSVAILLTPVWLFALGWGWYAQPRAREAGHQSRVSLPATRRRITTTPTPNMTTQTRGHTGVAAALGVRRLSA